MAIVVAAVVPHPPALLPGLTGAPIAEIEELRTRATGAVRWVLDAGPDAVVVVSGGDDTRECPPVTADGGAYRGTADAADAPLGLAVVAALLPTVTSRTVWQSVDRRADPGAAAALGRALAAVAPRVGLIVAGDGSARRGLKAPGYLDERAAPFDAQVERALAEGDAAALLALDAGLAAELLVAGRAAWQVLAGAVGDAEVTAELDDAGDPFGVWYAVARWRIG